MRTRGLSLDPPLCAGVACARIPGRGDRGYRGRLCHNLSPGAGEIVTDPSPATHSPRE